MIQDPLQRLAAAKASQLDEARPDAVARVHQTGRLTARERLSLLLDCEPDDDGGPSDGSQSDGRQSEGSQSDGNRLGVEFGSIAAVTAEGEWVPEAGGVDYIGSIGGQTVIASSTDFTDRGGGYGASRLERLFALAHQHRWPVVFFVDGGGSRARHPRTGLDHLELNGPFGRFQMFDGIAELSGWVPTVAIVSGPSFAGHASLAGFSDVVIATGGSSIGMGGPPMVEAALGLSLTANQLAGVEMHEMTGGIDLLVGDEVEAIAAARRYLGFYRDEAGGRANPAAPHIAALVPADGPYDMEPVIEAMVDNESFFELRPRFAPSVITGFGRMNGRSVGIIASQPNAADGVIDEDAATKAGRMVELCDAYEYPIVSLIDTPGTAITQNRGTTQATAQPGINRWHARAVLAHHHRTVPLFAVQVRRGGGLGPAILGGLNSGRSVPVFWAAWPSTELGVSDGYAAVRYQNAYDDVIAPVDTRRNIIRLLNGIPRRLDRAAKKHPIDTW